MAATWPPIRTTLAAVEPFEPHLSLATALAVGLLIGLERDVGGLLRQLHPHLWAEYLAASEGGALWNQLGSTMEVSNGTQVIANTALGTTATEGGDKVEFPLEELKLVEKHEGDFLP